MRNSLLGSAAVLALLATQAFAADLPARGPSVAPVPVFTQASFSWTGFYVGLNAGAAFNNRNRCEGFTPVNAVGVPQAPFPGCAGSGSDNAAFTGGAQIGYNWQFGSIVTGLEADLNYLSRNGRNGSSIVAAPGATFNPAFDGTYTFSNRQNGNYFGTVRARLGYAFDRALIYVTGGLAYGGNQNGAGNVAFTPNNPAGPVSAVYSSSARKGDRFGFTVGAGLEYALTNNWSVKGEYLYADLGRGRRGGAYNCTDVVAGTCAGQFGGGGAVPGGAFVGGGRGSNGIHAVRIGLNYLFNSSPGSVVARY